MLVIMNAPCDWLRFQQPQMHQRMVVAQGAHEAVVFTAWSSDRNSKNKKSERKTEAS